MNELSAPVRKLLAGGLLFATMFLGWIVLVAPIFAATGDAVERMHDARFELTRARAVVLERAKVSESAVLAEEQAVRQFLQEGNSLSDAIGFLQSNLDRLTRDSGLELDSMSAEPLVAKEPLAKAAVVLKARGSESAVLKMLAAVESQPAVMVIDRLVASVNEQGHQDNVTVAPVLTIELHIAGYWARRDTKEKTEGNSGG